MAALWKTVRVFISSTFRDMHAERDHLVRFIFPRLREELLKRRINLVDVDLRWGVTSDQDALLVCREIIDECRPRFLCILGGRYGWTPPGKEHSITAEEIKYGVLDRLGDHGYAYFHFRAPAATDSIPEETAKAGGYREFPQPDEIQQYGLAQAEAWARQRTEKLAALKQTIVDAGLKPTVYPATWDDHQQRLTDLEQFGEQVYRDLWESVLDDPELRDRFAEEAPAAADEFTEENEAMDAFVAERSERYVVGSRQGALDRLAAFAIADGQPNVLAVTGSPGCGKSALLGKFSRDLAAAHPDWLVVPHFVGASAGSSDLRRTLRRLCHELQRATGGSDPISQDVKELIPRLPALLKQVAAVRRVVLIVDALNQMDAADGAHSLNWLPMQLPVDARLVVSSLEHPVLEVLRRRGKLVEELTAHPLTAADARAIAEGLADRYHKRLSEEQTQQLLGKSESGMPLYLLVALEELRTLGTYEEITGRIAQLPGNVRDLFLWVLRDRLSTDPGFRDAAGKRIGTDLVRRFVSYLGVSRHGLSHQELVGLIAPGDQQGNVAALERLLRPYLMRRGKQLDFYHGQLREAVEREYLDEPHEPPAAHRALAGYFAAQGCNNRRTLEELPYHQTRAGLWDELEATLTNLPFLEGKTQAGLAFDLAIDFNDAVAALPEDRPQRHILRLLEKALRRDVHFVARHAQDYPQGLFQCLWNNGWWYDCDEAALHYVEPEGGWNEKNAPWLQPEEQRLCRLIERWRVSKEDSTPGFPWLAARRPPPVDLGTAQLAVLRGHKGEVRNVAFSPDGDRIVSDSDDATIRVWDAASGAEVAVLHGGNRHEASALVFSPGGDRIIYGRGYRTTVRVWDVASGASLAVLGGYNCEASSVTFSPGEDRIASGGGSWDKTVRVWDVASGTEVAILRGHKGTVTSVAFSPGGDRIASGGGDFDETVRVWDATSGVELAVLRGHKGAVTSVAFSPDGERIVSGSSDTTVRVWDPTSGVELAVLRGHEGAVTSVAFSPGEERIASGASDKTVRLWDPTSGVELAVFRGHEDQVLCVAFSPNRRQLASGGGSWDKTVRVWDIASGTGYAVRRARVDRVMSVHFSADGSRILSTDGLFSERVRVWDATSGAELAVLQRPNTRYGVGISPAADRIVSTSSDHSMRVWDTTSGEELAVLRGHKAYVGIAAFSPGCDRIASGSDDETVRVWDAANGAELAVLRGHEDYVRCVAFSPDGERIVSGSSDKTVRLWDAASGAELAVLRGHRGFVRSVAFSPDGERITSGSSDKTVRVWDARTTVSARIRSLLLGRTLAILRGHRGGVGVVYFSHDGDRIVSVSGENTVPVCDAKTTLWSKIRSLVGRTVGILRGHRDGVDPCSFYPGGDRIVSDGDGTARVWDAATGECLQVIQGHGDWPAIAAGSQQFPLRALVRGLETVVERSDNGEPVAWFPVDFGWIATHPSGRTWASTAVNYLCRITLEGGDTLRAGSEP